MRLRHALPIALAVVLEAPPAGAREPAATDPWDVVKKIIDLRNGGELDGAVALARGAFDAAGSDMDLRRTIAREGKDVAVKLFERDRWNPRRTEAAILALCWAIETMRTYQVELMTIERDRLTIPSEVIRLETLAAGLAAPCLAKEPEPAREPPPPTPGAAAERPGPAGSEPAASERPDPAPQVAVPRRSRARIGVGTGLMASGVGLAAGMTAALVGRRDNYKFLQMLAVTLTLRDDPKLTPQEQVDARLSDARVIRLERTAMALGTLAAVSFVAAVVVLVVPPRPVKGARARVQPEGVGFRLAF